MTAFQIKEDEFIIHHYNQMKPFASFLPAIAGIWGKPLWVYYVNRAQCISSFGTNDKNGAVTEFLAANKAYRSTPLQGFRTFLKIRRPDKCIFHEPFCCIPTSDDIKQTMYVKPDSIKIAEENKKIGINSLVQYFTLPNEDVPMLARILTLENKSGKDLDIELLDGLPLIQPYGITNFILKNMSRLAEGWFSGVQYSKNKKIPIFKLQVEPEDIVEITPVRKGNFYCGFWFDKGKRSFASCVVEPADIFDHCNDFCYPVNFFKDAVFNYNEKLTASNKSPSAMGYVRAKLRVNKVLNYYSAIGTVNDISLIEKFTERISEEGFFEKKALENSELIKRITHNIFTKSSSPPFDSYTRQTYLDNVLRGGLPISLETHKQPEVCYVFSRIHGDMEREYNDFEIAPTYFSQGSGNYRDVCQNRRCDIFFNANIYDQSLKSFYNLIQLDGFNPLKIKGNVYIIRQPNKVDKISGDKRLKKFLSEPFTIGSLFLFIEKNRVKIGLTKETFLKEILLISDKIEESEFGEGYWSDHWHYNTDLLESFRAVYPDKLEETLFYENDYTFHDTHIFVKPRSEKFVLWHGKPRQNDPLFHDGKKKKIIESRKDFKEMVRTAHGRGNVYRTSLFAKLLSIIANKYASLDPFGVGVEMETGKPNWCDALNGLPGLFGSSSCESFELKRLILLLKDIVNELRIDANRTIKLPVELFEFIDGLKNETDRYKDNFTFWDVTHNIKEKYREKVKFGLSGKEKEIGLSYVIEILDKFTKKIDGGLSKIVNRKTGFCYSHFINEVVKYKLTNKKNSKGFPLIRPLKFKQCPLVYYLEGIVHSLKVNRREAKQIYNAVLKSNLYDPKLKMYKVNEPLKNVSVEIGRAKIFTPGWLENESIWLHMEYKYLLELLNSDCKDEFFREMRRCLIPFMNPNVYGRSTLENVSFLVSSSHPDKNLWGNGFVSRLSGATAEFVNMWVIMTAGKRPFILDEERKVCLKFNPCLPNWLFTTTDENVVFHPKTGRPVDVKIPKNSFAFNFLGNVMVIYRNAHRKNTFGKNKVKPVRYVIFTLEGKRIVIDSDVIPEPYSLAIRKGEVKKIETDLE